MVDCACGLKRKTKKNQTKSKTTAGKKGEPMKKAVKHKVTPKKKLAKKRANPTKAKGKKKVGGKKAGGGKTAGKLKKRVLEKSQSVDTVALAPEGLEARSGEQSGDLQGLSNVQGADSESVDELLEEGNASEAGAVKGVEDAGDTDEGEVRTHEVPQDDVPGEYLDKE